MSECLQLTESAHRDFLATGHLDRAAAQALDLGGMLAMRGEPALASGWLGRARRLLADQPVGPIHGLLWYVDLSMALEEARLDEAERLATELRRLGDEHGDESLVALGYLGVGARRPCAAAGSPTRSGCSRRPCFAWSAAASPPTGPATSTARSSRPASRVADLNRARHWSEAAHRWLEDFSEAVMFTGVCRAHDVELLVAEGAWVAAGQQADVVVTELRELNVEAVAEAEYQHGECHRLRGDLDSAADVLRAGSIARAGPSARPGTAAPGPRRGRRARGPRSLTRWSVDPRIPFRCARLLRAQVEIGVATGRSDAAAAAARRLRTLADDFGTPGFEAWADHAAGLVALAAGRPRDALEPLLLGRGGLPTDAGVVRRCERREPTCRRRTACWGMPPPSVSIGTRRSRLSDASASRREPQPDERPSDRRAHRTRAGGACARSRLG